MNSKARLRAALSSRRVGCNFICIIDEGKRAVGSLYRDAGGISFRSNENLSA